MGSCTGRSTTLLSPKPAFLFPTRCLVAMLNSFAYSQRCHAHKRVVPHCKRSPQRRFWEHAPGWLCSPVLQKQFQHHRADDRGLIHNVVERGERLCVFLVSLNQREVARWSHQTQKVNLSVYGKEATYVGKCLVGAPSARRVDLAEPLPPPSLAGNYP